MVCGTNIPPLFTSAGRTVLVSLAVDQAGVTRPDVFSLTYKTACMYSQLTHSLAHLLV